MLEEKLKLIRKHDQEGRIKVMIIGLGSVGNYLLSYLLSKLEDNATFSEKVLWWIEKKERKPSEIYGKVGISKQLFAKIRSNPQYHPTKETVFAFAIALHLDKKDTIDLLKRAGYALSDSSISDTIVSFFIDNERYNIDEINEVLYEYECRTLTNWRDS